MRAALPRVKTHSDYRKANHHTITGIEAEAEAEEEEDW